MSARGCARSNTVASVASKMTYWQSRTRNKSARVVSTLRSGPEDYDPCERQKIFQNSRAKYRLFGGAAGPGKTKALLWEAIRQAHKVDRCDTLLLRRTYPELESSLLAYFRRDVRRELYKSYNESKHLVTWTNGSTTRFGYCRNENDVYQYQGAEFLFIGIDELTHFTLKQWQFLTSRNRCSVAGNGFGQAGGAQPRDQAPPTVRGRWISIDWGFQHPSAVYWHCAVPGRPSFAIPSEARNFSSSYGQRDPSAAPLSQDDNPCRIVTYREFVQNGLSPRMLAQAIAERSGRERINEIFLSPDAFAHRTSEASIAEQLGDVLVANGLPRPAPADDDRIGGWQLMYQLLESNAWVITENSAKLIECISQLLRDDRRQEDIPKIDGDDPADAARYGLVSGGRLAGVGPAFVPSRAGQPPPLYPPLRAPPFLTR